METIRGASIRAGALGRGRGGHWAVTGRDPELREVEREFVRRLWESAELLESLDRIHAAATSPSDLLARQTRTG